LIAATLFCSPCSSLPEGPYERARENWEDQKRLKAKQRRLDDLKHARSHRQEPKQITLGSGDDG
jgi:hypothetical protein